MGMGGDSFDKDYTCFRNNLFMNNIYAYNDLENGRCLRFTHRSSAENCLVAGNLFVGNTPETKTIHAVTYPERADYTAEAANAALPEYYKDNFTADPAFADPDKGNFILKANSPAIDKALPLTRVAKMAEGYFIFGNPKPSTFLPVEDARFFYDGFGLEGEKGDVIMVGPDKKLARIIRIYPRQKILHLDRPIPVKPGETVQLAYEGNAPDLGAYEFNAAKSTGPVFDDKSIRQNPDPQTLIRKPCSRPIWKNPPQKTGSISGISPASPTVTHSEPKAVSTEDMPGEFIMNLMKFSATRRSLTPNSPDRVPLCPPI